MTSFFLFFFSEILSFVWLHYTTASQRRKAADWRVCVCVMQHFCFVFFKSSPKLKMHCNIGSQAVSTVNEGLESLLLQAWGPTHFIKRAGLSPFLLPLPICLLSFRAHHRKRQRARVIKGPAFLLWARENVQQ